MVGVRGSIPLAPTISIADRREPPLVFLARAKLRQRVSDEDARQRDRHAEPGRRIRQMVVREGDDRFAALGQVGGIGARVGVDRERRVAREAHRARDRRDVAREPLAAGGIVGGREPGALLARAHEPGDARFSPPAPLEAA